MGLEELLAKLAEDGWRVNNLFQKEGGEAPLWQANLRRPGEITSWGFGRSAQEALRAALMAERTPLELRRVFPAGEVPLGRTEGPVQASDLGLGE